MESIRIYKCGKSIVSISSIEKYIIRSEGAFYYPTKDVFKSCFDVHEMKLERIVRDNILLPIGMILIIMVSLAYYFNSAKYVIVDNNFALSTVMLLVNIPLHEIGHVLMLKNCILNVKSK